MQKMKTSLQKTGPNKHLLISEWDALMSVKVQVAQKNDIG